MLRLLNEVLSELRDTDGAGVGVVVVVVVEFSDAISDGHCFEELTVGWSQSLPVEHFGHVIEVVS
jgi:hypothetical protein